MSDWNTTPLVEDTFSQQRREPFEFRWVNISRPGDPVEMVYKKCPIAKVIDPNARYNKGRSTRGGAKAPTGLAGVMIDCSGCGKTHSPLNPCGL